MLLLLPDFTLTSLKFMNLHLYSPKEGKKWQTCDKWSFRENVWGLRSASYSPIQLCHWWLPLAAYLACMASERRSQSEVDCHAIIRDQALWTLQENIIFPSSHGEKALSCFAGPLRKAGKDGNSSGNRSCCWLLPIGEEGELSVQQTGWWSRFWTGMHGKLIILCPCTKEEACATLTTSEPYALFVMRWDFKHPSKVGNGHLQWLSMQVSLLSTNVQQPVTCATKQYCIVEPCSTRVQSLISSSIPVSYYCKAPYCLASHTLLPPLPCVSFPVTCKRMQYRRKWLRPKQKKGPYRGRCPRISWNFRIYFRMQRRSQAEGSQPKAPRRRYMMSAIEIVQLSTSCTCAV